MLLAKLTWKQAYNQALSIIESSGISVNDYSKMYIGKTFAINYQVLSGEISILDGKNPVFKTHQSPMGQTLEIYHDGAWRHDLNKIAHELLHQEGS